MKPEHLYRLWFADGLHATHVEEAVVLEVGSSWATIERPAGPERVRIGEDWHPTRRQALRSALERAQYVEGVSRAQMVEWTGLRRDVEALLEHAETDAPGFRVVAGGCA